MSFVHLVGAIILGSLVLSSTMEIEQSLTVKSNSRCAFQCCIVKNVNVVFPAVRPCCLEKTKQQNKMRKNAKLYFRRISAILCDFLTANQISNVHSDGRMGWRAGPKNKGCRKKKSGEQRAQSIEVARTRVSNTSEESRFVTREPLTFWAWFFSRWLAFSSWCMFCQKCRMVVPKIPMT